MIQNNRQNAHQEIDHIFKELLPAHGMTERPAQVALSHRMLDAMLDDSIALCDAGTGIGKTYAYLVAGIGVPPEPGRLGAWLNQPVLISTSSIALQNAVLEEYLPFLSAVLMAGSADMDHPLRAVRPQRGNATMCATSGCGGGWGRWILARKEPAGQRGPAVPPGSPGSGHGGAPQRL